MATKLTDAAWTRLFSLSALCIPRPPRRVPPLALLRRHRLRAGIAVVPSRVLGLATVTNPEPPRDHSPTLTAWPERLACSPSLRPSRSVRALRLVANAHAGPAIHRQPVSLTRVAAEVLDRLHPLTPAALLHHLRLRGKKTTIIFNGKIREYRGAASPHMAKPAGKCFFCAHINGKGWLCLARLPYGPAPRLQIKNHQLSWWFDGEPLKAVLKDSATFGMGLWDH